MPLAIHRREQTLACDLVKVQGPVGCRACSNPGLAALLPWIMSWQHFDGHRPERGRLLSHLAAYPDSAAVCSPPLAVAGFYRRGFEREFENEPRSIPVVGIYRRHSATGLNRPLDAAYKQGDCCAAGTGIGMADRGRVLFR